MFLTENQKRQLRRIGHTLKPVVIIGSNGLTDSVHEEIDSTISHHELIKIKVNAGDREERNAMIEAICTRNNATLVQRIGHIALIYRRNPEKTKIHI